jgi:lipopolysaccharide export system protein LptC
VASGALEKRGWRERWATPGGRHDRVIHALRIALPVAIGAMVAVLALAPLTSGRDISFVLSKDRVEVAKERMRVTDALYRGQDAQGQPFSLRAGSAVQATSRDPVVKLSALTAKIQLQDGPADVVAKTGRYDMNAQKVYVDGPVTFNGPDNYRMLTRDVSIDLNTRKVVSGAPVDGTMRLGRFSGNKMTADLNARTVRLDGRARLHIDRRGGRAAR